MRKIQHLFFNVYFTSNEALQYMQYVRNLKSEN